MAPFALIISDGNFYLSEYLLTDLADRRAQRRNRSRGVEVEHGHKIFRLQIGFRLQPASAHKHVGDADFCGVPELYLGVELIIIVKIGIVNVVENVPFVICPIFSCKLGGCCLHLLDNAVAAGHTVAPLQRGGNGIFMLRTELPEVHGAGVLPFAGVSHIKDVSQLWLLTACVYKGNAVGAAPDKAPHLFVPEIVLGAGSCVRPLGVDHDLFVIRILVEPCGCAQELRPAFVAACELPLRCVCHLPVLLIFTRHRATSFG